MCWLHSRDFSRNHWRFNFDSNETKCFRSSLTCYRYRTSTNYFIQVSITWWNGCFEETDRVLPLFQIMSFRSTKCFRSDEISHNAWIYFSHLQPTSPCDESKGLRTHDKLDVKICENVATNQITFTISRLIKFQGVITYFQRHDLTNFLSFITSEGSAHGW